MKITSVLSLSTLAFASVHGARHGDRARRHLDPRQSNSISVLSGAMMIEEAIVTLICEMTPSLANDPACLTLLAGSGSNNGSSMSSMSPITRGLPTISGGASMTVSTSDLAGGSTPTSLSMSVGEGSESSSMADTSTGGSGASSIFESSMSGVISATSVVDTSIGGTVPTSIVDSSSSGSIPATSMIGSAIGGSASSSATAGPGGGSSGSASPTMTGPGASETGMGGPSASDSSMSGEESATSPPTGGVSATATVPFSSVDGQSYTTSIITEFTTITQATTITATEAATTITVGSILTTVESAVTRVSTVEVGTTNFVTATSFLGTVTAGVNTVMSTTTSTIIATQTSYSCPPGSSGSNTTCTQCPAGSFSGGALAQCAPCVNSCCPQGSASDLVGGGVPTSFGTARIVVTSLNGTFMGYVNQTYSPIGLFPYTTVPSQAILVNQPSSLTEFPVSLGLTSAPGPNGFMTLALAQGYNGNDYSPSATTGSYSWLTASAPGNAGDGFVTTTDYGSAGQTDVFVLGTYNCAIAGWPLTLSVVDQNTTPQTGVNFFYDPQTIGIGAAGNVATLNTLYPSDPSPQVLLVLVPTV